MSETVSFGDWVRRRRRALDLTQDALAQQVGCAVVTLRKIESDERRPSRQVAERLAECLQIPAEQRPAFLAAARTALAVDRPPRPAPPLADAAPAPPTPAARAEPLALPSGTVTFLFTDIESSTTLWERHPQTMREALARHDALLRAVIVAHAGSVFKTVGDAVHAAFTSAANALAAALDAQRALRHQTWGEVGPLRVRMALHTGVAELREGDYVGRPLNRLARLLAAGHGGQILLSQASAALLRDELPPDAQLRDLGEHRLRDLARPEQIFQLVAPDLPADFPPLNTLDYRPTNLPAQPTPLIGREQELAVVCELLRGGKIRLLTLSGPGGTGKTRLALQAAADLLDAFAHGAYFVNLAPISDAGLVITTIAQALTVTETAGQPLLETLKRYLSDKQLLLLLDNFEQVVDAAPLIAELLTGAPRLTILVTSRVRLQLSGEHEFVVPPLNLPDLRRLPALEHLTQYAAVELFISRAQAVKYDFVVTNENAPAVAEICYRLDGLPLAIELAAARSRLLAPQALLARLSSRLTLLTGGARDLPARQQTLRNTIEWSYNLLDEAEQTLFRRLAVFVGGWALEAALAIVLSFEFRVLSSESDNSKLKTQNSELDILGGMMSLLDKSLLRQAESADEEPRFIMLETIREYAMEKLLASGEASRLRSAHLAFFVDLVGTAEPELYGSKQAGWLARLESAHDNVRAALRWALEQGDSTSALQLSAIMGEFWELRGYWSEGRQWLEQTLALSHEAGSSGSSASAARGWLALAYWQAGTLAWRQCDFASARGLLEQSLSLYRELDNPDGLTNVLANLAGVAFEQGEYATARAIHEECLAVRRTLGNAIRIGDSLFGLGLVAYHQGEYAAAQTFLLESLKLAREAGHTLGITYPLNALGNVANLQGDYAAAQTFYEECLTLRRQLGYKRGVAATLADLANLRAKQGQYTAARALYEESLMLFRELGNQRGMAYALSGLACLAQAQGHPLMAAQLLSAVEALLARMDARLDEPQKTDIERAVAALRSELDAGRFNAAWEQGSRLTLEEMIALACEIA